MARHLIKIWQGIWVSLVTRPSATNELKIKSDWKHSPSHHAAIPALEAPVTRLCSTITILIWQRIWVNLVTRPSATNELKIKSDWKHSPSHHAAIPALEAPVTRLCSTITILIWQRIWVNLVTRPSATNELKIKSDWKHSPSHHAAIPALEAPVTRLCSTILD